MDECLKVINELITFAKKECLLPNGLKLTAVVSIIVFCTTDINIQLILLLFLIIHKNK